MLVLINFNHLELLVDLCGDWPNIEVCGQNPVQVQILSIAPTRGIRTTLIGIFRMIYKVIFTAIIFVWRIFHIKFSSKIINPY